MIDIVNKFGAPEILTRDSMGLCTMVCIVRVHNKKQIFSGKVFQGYSNPQSADPDGARRSMGVQRPRAREHSCCIMLYSSMYIVG